MCCYPKNHTMAFLKIEIKWDWVSNVHVYIKSDAVIWFRQYCHLKTRQRTAKYGANKLTVKVELVLLREKWILFFDQGTFWRHVFMLSTRFVRTSENGLSHKTWSYFLFAQHIEAYLMLGLWWSRLRYDNVFLMLENEGSISVIDSITFSCPTCLQIITFHVLISVWEDETEVLQSSLSRLNSGEQVSVN